MDLELKDKVGIVTAAGSGIGLVTTHRLVDEGMLVVGADIDVAELEGMDGVTAVQADMAIANCGERVVDAAVQAYGRVDALVNGVGTLFDRPGGYTTVSDADWERTIALNLLSAIRCARAAVPRMIAGGGGSIVNIASAAAREPSTRAPDYAVTKAGMIALTKVLSTEFGGKGIRVNAVSPGPTRTVAWENWMKAKGEEAGISFDEAAREFIVNTKRMALPQVGDPGAVAAVIAFLLSAASKQVTGSDYRVDGGAVQSL